MSGTSRGRDHLGFVEEGAQVSLDHKVEALFLLLVHLMQYMVKTKNFGRASLRRTSKLVERIRLVAQGVRTFHAQNAQMAASAQFEVKFVQGFNEDTQQWTEEVHRLAPLLKQEPESSFPGPSDVGPMPLPPFSRTHTRITAAPIDLGDTGYAGEPATGGYR